MEHFVQMLATPHNPPYRLIDVPLPAYTIYWALGGLVLFIESVGLFILSMSQIYAAGVLFMLVLIGFAGVYLFVIGILLRKR